MPCFLFTVISLLEQEQELKRTLESVYMNYLVQDVCIQGYIDQLPRSLE